MTDRFEDVLKLFDRKCWYAIIPLYINVVFLFIDALAGKLGYEWIPCLIGASVVWIMYRTIRRRMVIDEVRFRFTSVP